MEMGRVLMEYCLNAVWLVPVAAGAAWLLVRVASLRPAGEHRVWLGTLMVCLALPGVEIRVPRVESPVRVSALRTPRISAEPTSAPVAELPVSEGMIEPVKAEPGGPALPLQDHQAWRRWRMRSREIALPSRIIRWFAWTYAGAMGFAVFRMARVWRAALRLVRDATPYSMNEAEDALLQELAAKFQMRVPRVLCSDRIRSPVAVGIWRTVLLVPESFARCAEAERRAALCHELAHVRRRDCLVHTGVQVLILPLVWHPAAHLVGRRIARTREMVCDEMAAAAMGSIAGELMYARCLLNLAHTMLRQHAEPLPGLGLGLFRTNKLEERVMRLTEMKRVLSVRQMLLRRAGGVAVAGMVLMAGAMVHVAPVVAQQSAPVPPAPATSSQTPVETQAPVAPSLPAPQPAPAPRPANETPGAGPLAGAGDSFGSGTSGSDGSGMLQDEHGPHVIVKDGTHVHHWTGEDGERYEVHDAQAAPYTKQQERAAEAEFADRVRREQEELDHAIMKLNGGTDGVQIDERSTAELAKAAAELAKATAQFNSPTLKAQMAKLNSPQFKAQLDALQSQIARIDSKSFQDQIDSLTSAQVGAKLAEAERQAIRVDTPEMEQKLADAERRLDEASARLEAATKALAEAQKRLQATPAK